MATKKVVKKKVAKKKTPKKSETTEVTIKPEPENKENVFAKIARTITKLSVAIVAIVVIFSPENVWVLGPVIGSLAIMGISLGYFASK